MGNIRKNISIYFDGNDYVIVPNIKCIGGYYIHSPKFFTISNTDKIAIKEVGKAVINAVDIIETSPIDSRIKEQRDADGVWGKDKKYKTYNSFWKNNFCASVSIEKNNIKIWSMEKSDRTTGYCGCIEEIALSLEATALQIGNGVVGVLKSAERFYQRYTLALYLTQEKGLIIVPVIKHRNGFYYEAEWYKQIMDIYDKQLIYLSMEEAFEFVKNAPVDTRTVKERKNNAVWIKATSYKKWFYFFKKAFLSYIHLYPDGEYEICATSKSNYGTEYHWDKYKRQIKKDTSAQQLIDEIFAVFEYEKHKIND